MNNVIDYFERWHRGTPSLLEYALKETSGDIYQARLIVWHGMLEYKRRGIEIPKTERVVNG